MGGAAGLLVVLGLLVGPGWGGEDGVEAVIFAVVVDPSLREADLQLTVSGNWLGEPRSTALRDEGSAGDVLGDGVWTARWTGAPVRMLPVRLSGGQPGSPQKVLAASTEMLGTGADHSITWAWDPTQPDRARRVALALPARQMERMETVLTAASFGWVALVMLFGVWWLGEAGTRRSRGRRRG